MHVHVSTKKTYVCVVWKLTQLSDQLFPLILGTTSGVTFTTTRLKVDTGFPE